MTAICPHCSRRVVPEAGGICPLCGGQCEKPQENESIRTCLATEDIKPSKQEESSPRQMPFSSRRACLFLTKASIWCVVLSVCGTVMYFIVKMNGPDSFLHRLLFFELPRFMLGTCILLWLTFRLIVKEPQTDLHDPPSAPTSSYGGYVILFCTIFCVSYFPLSLVFLFVTLNVLRGN